jgi:hypothetical protein
MEDNKKNLLFNIIAWFRKILVVPYNRLFRFYSTLDQHKREGDTIFVLGNAPSLKKQLDEYINQLKNYPCICVNGFADSEYYEKLRPKIYMILDPGTLDKDEVLNKNSEKHIYYQTFLNIHDRTTWKMDFIVPSLDRKGNALVEYFKENKNINILYINTMKCRFYFREKRLFRLFGRNLLMPHAATVIIAAVYA